MGTYLKTKKRNIKLAANLDITSSRLWEIITEINRYPNYIKFVYWARINGRFEAGSTWTDLSTILFIPILVRHEIMKIRTGRKVLYLIKLPFGGKIMQIFEIKQKQKTTDMSIEIVIDLKNPILDSVLGKFLERRTKFMLNSTLENFREKALQRSAERVKIFRHSII